MIGPGMVVFLLLSEIYPTRVRGLAMSVSIVALWGSFLVVSMTLLSLIDWLGRPLTFWLFGGLCVVALIFVLRFAPETRGRSLEDIEASWHRGAASG
jgi:MFS family permease